MPLLLTTDAEEFAARGEAFLAARLERNILATVLHVARTRGGFGGGPPLFALVTAETTGEPFAAAIRTPPWPILAVGIDTPELADRLIERWLTHDPEPPGVSGPPATARAISGAYEQITGAGTELESAEAMFALTRVNDPPRPAPGSLRRATPADRELLIAWEDGFTADVDIRDRPAAAPNVERRLEDGFQYLWTRPDGAPVATVVHSQPIKETARIGPVYTPPEHRRNGYAASATAALSRRLLSGEATADPVARCMLFAQLSNPTSNKIYQEIGFVRLADWERRRFHQPGGQVPD